MSRGSYASQNYGAPPALAYVRRFAYDGSGNQIYEGWAAPGTATSAAGWAIAKHTFDGSNQETIIQWADGDTSEDNVWDDRATLTYS